MQKGGRINYNSKQKVWYGTHSASRYEAEALTLLGFQPTKTGLTSMNSAMYNNAATSNRNYNSTLLDLYDILAKEKKIEVYDCLQRASNERENQNKKFEKKSKKSNDMGHLNYREFIENALRQIKFGPNTLTTPSSVRQSQKKVPILAREQDYSQNYSRTDTRRRQLTYLGKENAGNKFKKTRKRRKIIKKRDTRRRKRENKREKIN